MLEQLKRPFKKRYDQVRTVVSNFMGPVKNSVLKLLALIPKGLAFVGFEDAAHNSDNVEGTETSGAKQGLVAKLKNFKQSIKDLSDFQKLILLTIAVVLPAGILIAMAIAGLLHKKK